MIKTPKRFGSFVGAVGVAVILIPILGLISVYALIFAGILAGVASRGVTRAALATVIAGFILVAIIMGLAVFNAGTFLFNISNQVQGIGLLSHGIRSVVYFIDDSTVSIVEKSLFYLVLIPGLGGLIGGLIRPGF